MDDLTLLAKFSEADLNTLTKEYPNGHYGERAVQILEIPELVEYQGLAFPGVSPRAHPS